MFKFLQEVTLICENILKSIDLNEKGERKNMFL